jgi:hypothetical protein
MAAMASMSRNTEKDVSSLHLDNMPRYNADIDTLREEEYPMLQGSTDIQYMSQSRKLMGFRNDLSGPRWYNSLPQVPY